MSAHAFVRPGQVMPDRPVPDRCMRCGCAEAEAVHRIGDRTAAEVVADEEQLAHEKRLIKAARSALAEFLGEDLRQVDQAWMAYRLGQLSYCSQALADALALRHAAECNVTNG